MSETVYEPALSSLEQRAYIAAHKIMALSVARHLACPGERRSRMLDRIAEIIVEACKDGQL